MSDYPILTTWDGEVLRPVNSMWARRADQQWVVGERYMVEIQHERSTASHRAYFAELNACFENLPDDLAERWPTVEHLRKYALVRTGFRDERTYIAPSKADAARLAAFLRPMDEFAVISVHEYAVVVWTAKSQNMRSMGKAEFQRSREAVLSFVAEMIGVTSDEVKRAATERAA